MHFRTDKVETMCSKKKYKQKETLGRVNGDVKKRLESTGFFLLRSHCLIREHSQYYGMLQENVPYLLLSLADRFLYAESALCYRVLIRLIFAFF